ncbi:MULTISPECIES: hypothetical protein [unclassified Bacillus (in: firmicutes)]|uniref:hypothetical protein n=1 Tax=unclassified Bacillus (in: firmicutes) TaxID=185979 RepID=UPI001912EF31|nr:hypothetical protein [Bacillus sp. TH17]MBK5491334.1 hypothetical protein [Bacillus sp. TH17]
MIKISKTEEFEEKLRRHNKRMEEDETYRAATKMLTFPAGHKLELVIEVTDEYYSHNLHNLLRGNIEGAELLGFKVNELVINPKEREKSTVRKFLNQVAQDYNL